MPLELKIIPTRQLTEALFGTEAALPAGGSFVSDPKLVAGFFAVNLLAVSDQPFQVVVQEACSADGQFVQTAAYMSEPFAGLHRLCVQHLPCGPYMMTTLGNLGADQDILSFCATGLPMP